LLTARSLAAPLATDRGNESAALHVSALDRDFVSALQSGVGKFPKRFIKEKADVRRSDLVGRNVVAQPGVVSRIPGVPREVFSSQLLLDQGRVFRQEEDATLQTYCRCALFDLLVEKFLNHCIRLASLHIFILRRRTCGADGFKKGQK